MELVKGSSAIIDLSEPCSSILLPRGSGHTHSVADLIQLIDTLNIREGEYLVRFLFERSLKTNIFNVDPGNCISTLTYNIAGLPPFLAHIPPSKDRYMQIRTAIAESGVEIVALQEMWHRDTMCIMDLPQLPHHTRSEKPGSFFGSSGLITLSKFPIVQEELLPFTLKSGLERAVAKGALYTRLEIKTGEYLDIYNVHLASDPERLNTLFVNQAAVNAIRRSQLSELKHWISERSSQIPFLILGDFNIEESSSLYSEVRSLAATDIFRDRNGACTSNDRLDLKEHKWGFTFDPRKNQFTALSARNPERIDYPLFSSHGKSCLFSSELCFTETPLSDHFGVKSNILFLD